MDMKYQVIDGRLELDTDVKSIPREALSKSMPRESTPLPPPPDRPSPKAPSKKVGGQKRHDDLTPITPSVLDKLINKKPVTITLRQGQCPGDILSLTAAVRDLKTKFDNVQLIMRTSAHPYMGETIHT